MRRPRSSEWTKLGDAAPAKRMTEEPDVDKDIDTSAMILLSGEFELVDDDDAAPSKEELASARPPRLAPKLFVAALAMLAGGGVLAHRYVPRFHAEVDSLVAAMRPAPMPMPMPTPTPTAATAAPAPTPTPTPVAVVPKMIAPTPKMREPTPPVEQKTAQKTPQKVEPKKAPSAKAKTKRTRYPH